jgi:large subunit ribosomal protein L19
MTSALIEELEKDQLKTNLPEMFPGDTVRVWTRIREGDKERVQAFEGTVVGLKGRGLSERLMVYRVAYRQAMQKNFPLHSPSIEKIEVVKRGQVRRAKLTYLIGKTGKKARVLEKMATESVAAAPTYTQDTDV